MSGVFQAILNVFSIRPWGASGFIDFFLYDLPMPPSVTRWPYFILIGIIQAILFYYVFKFFVLKFNLKTPGREDDEADVKLYSKKEYLENKTANEENKINNIIKAIGGKENIISVDNCFTRLRLELKDINIIDEALLKETGSHGVVKKGQSVQIIYGLSVNSIKNKVEKALNKE